MSVASTHRLGRRSGAANSTPAGPPPDVRIPGQRTGPRVWLVAGTTGPAGEPAEPADHPVVRDDLMRCWCAGADGRWHTEDGRHHATWGELHARFDLMEVTV